MAFLSSCSNSALFPSAARRSLKSARCDFSTTGVLRSAGCRPSISADSQYVSTLNRHQQQLLIGPRLHRYVTTAAAGPDEEPITVDVEASTISSSSQRSSRTASEAVTNTADAATAAVNAAASTADAAVSDASDVASALVTDAANMAAAAVTQTAVAATAAVDAAASTADAVVSDASDVASALVTDAANVAAAAAAAATTEAEPASAGYQTSSSSSRSPVDERFADMKVLVTGATGGVGRRVVEALRAKGIPCRALVRDRARAVNLLPSPASNTYNTSADESSEFDIVTGDVYQYATLPAAMAGCNAVVVASAANDKSDPFGPFNIDYQGTLNLIAAAKRAGVKRFVFVTSIGADDPFNPLNLFWGILFWKKRAEEELQRSGLSYTIVRPGGLKNTLNANETFAGNIVMEGPNTFGFPPMKRSGAILRSQVADVCVEALVCPAAADKVVEIIADKAAPARPLHQLFESVAV